MGHKVGRKAALWGAILGTIPDLDVLIPMSDPIADFVYHRSFSHSFLVLGLLAPICAWLIMRFHKWDPSIYKRWLFATVLIFFTHILLDSFTVYGTQIFWPFTHYPVSIGSIFIIDPLYTLPMIIGLIFCFRAKTDIKGLKINNYALAFSTVYLLWSLGIQTYVSGIAESSLKGKTLRQEKILTIPTPFNTLLWRIVAIGEKGYYVGYYSIFDKNKDIEFDFIPSRYDMISKLEPIERFRDMQRHSHGFYSIDYLDDSWVVSDIRMGIEKSGYVFQYAIAKNGDGDTIVPTKISRFFSVRDLSMVKNIFARILNKDISTTH
jgi:inner membrane protein